MTPRARTGRRVLLTVVFALFIGTIIGLYLSDMADASAVKKAGVLAAPSSLHQVINNLRNLIVGLLVVLATLFLTVGGVRYILAGGDPGEVEAAKKTLRYAALGYGIAALAPLLVSILKGIVGT
ncbi:pilin [Sinosporangium siamense]|uniref:pilin n=1 Tax=Sinosporangium siamense TaxID=1367973 RepID=UPI001EF22AAB|nr:pilin [Sinosporangium siamense]